MTQQTLYKLTDKDGYTRRGERNQLHWSEGCTHSALLSGNELCSGAVIHAYYDPLLAILLNPLHCAYDLNSCRLFECSGEIVATDYQLKCGVKTLHCIREITKPEITTEQRARFAILCAKLVYNDPSWNNWADNWLNNVDRSTRAARYAASYAASEASAAASEARYAANAARSASYAASDAASVASDAASAASYAVYAASSASSSFDLINIAQRACSTIPGES